MPIHVLREPATTRELQEMQAALQSYIKLAVDVRLGVVAGGGEMHADCEAVLLSEGCQQDDVWGADWDPVGEEVGFVSLINIRPARGNRSMQIEDPDVRDRVERIVRRLLQPQR